MNKRSRMGFETGVVGGGSAGSVAPIRGSGLSVGVGAGGRPVFAAPSGKG